MFLDFLGWRGANYFGGDAFLMNGGDRTLASYGYFGRGKSDPDRLRAAAGARGVLPSARAVRTAKATTCSCTLGSASAACNLATRATPYASRAPRICYGTARPRICRTTSGVTIVYGHTPRADFEVRWNAPFSIGIDTGAIYGGPLTAIRLPDQSLVQTD